MMVGYEPRRRRTGVLRGGRRGEEEMHMCNRQSGGSGERWCEKRNWRSMGNGGPFSGCTYGEHHISVVLRPEKSLEIKK